MSDLVQDAGSIRALSADIAAGRLTSVALVERCLARIAAVDDQVRAWVSVQADAALAQARVLDAEARAGRLRGTLHGIPVGVKDVLDIAGLLTRACCPARDGLPPAGSDATVVSHLRAAGAVVLGKLHTTELAFYEAVPPTRNPHDPARTPGGSSAGSGAAVAAGMVPLALGTQTAGSTMRPASFCGVFAFKPTWGTVSREGLKLYAASLDTLTWFARSVADLDLLAEVFAIADDAPPVPVPMRGARIALCHSPAWSFAQPGTEMAMDVAAARLRAAGAVVTMLDLPESFADLGFGVHQAVMFSEGRAAFMSLARTHPDLLHDDFHARVENRTGISRARLAAAYDQAAACRAAFDAIARDYDAILTPSARGEAPLLEAGPGDAVFNRMWTLLHVPCVGIPVCAGPGGLPVGVTLVGPRFADRQLLVTAQAVAEAMAPDSP